MTTTTIISANEFAKKLGIPTEEDIIILKEKSKEDFKNDLIEEINLNLEEYKCSPVVLTREHCNLTKMTREELVTFGKQLANEFKKAGYLVAHEYEYKSSNKEKYYSFGIGFKGYDYGF